MLRLLALFVVGLALTAGCDSDKAKRKRKRRPAAVAVAPVTTGAIELRRTYTGNVAAKERFLVAAHVAGRVRKLLVDLSDSVTRGQIVAELDDREHVQGVGVASADLVGARANLASARSALIIATRELERIKALRARGVVPAAELDRAKTRHLTAATAVKVARAQVLRMGAGLQSAKIRSGYNKVVASWSGADKKRIVSERRVSEGDRVTAGQALFAVVKLSPINVVIHVGETEYASLAVDQKVVVTTDAYPGKELGGVVKRISPVFKASSRQARVEIQLPNKQQLLRPGMFVRARIVLQRRENVTVVPSAALTTRGGVSGVFVVNQAGNQVRWRPVKVGIREGKRLQVTGKGITGRVVVLGHQLIADKSKITIPKPK